jgi:hypothetical protein
VPDTAASAPSRVASRDRTPWRRLTEAARSEPSPRRRDRICTHFSSSREDEERAAGRAYDAVDVTTRSDEHDGAAGAALRAAGPSDDVVLGEARWPMAAAVLAAIALTAVLPDSERAGPRWLLPVIEGLLLIALVVGDPGKIDRRSRTLRVLSIVLVSVLVLGALWSTAALIGDLIHGGAVTNSASELLEAGFAVWTLNIIAFALLYWELDAGGPAVRAHHRSVHPDLAFPQHLTPGIAPPSWRPLFIDYLYLGFTNATALSPTDVMPLVPWAKITMAIQSVISIAILGLVVARAVNVFA